MRSRISIRGSVRWSVCRSYASWNYAKVPYLTKTTTSTSENASYAVYPALFSAWSELASLSVTSYPQSPRNPFISVDFSRSFFFRTPGQFFSLVSFSVFQGWCISWISTSTGNCGIWFPRRKKARNCISAPKSKGDAWFILEHRCLVWVWSLFSCFRNEI